MKQSTIIILFLLSLFVSCNKDKNTIIGKDDNPRPHFIAYKLKGDYIKNVCIELSPDKTKITVIPGPTDPGGDSSHTCYYELIDGYYMEWGQYSYGLNSAYLDISRHDYAIKGMLPIDSIMKHILDKDPYSEYYIDINDTVIKDTTVHWHLNNYIENDGLVNRLHFKRIK